MVESSGPTTSGRRGFRRPSGVTLVAWLFLLQFVLLLVSGNIFWPGGRLEVNVFNLPEETVTRYALEGVFIALGLLALLVAVGLFRLRPWAWLLAMTIEGLNFASALIAYSVGQPEYLTMVVGIIIVASLNQPEVRQAFLSERYAP